MGMGPSPFGDVDDLLFTAFALLAAFALMGLYGCLVGDSDQNVNLKARAMKKAWDKHDLFGDDDDVGLMGGGRRAPDVKTKGRKKAT